MVDRLEDTVLRPTRILRRFSDIVVEKVETDVRRPCRIRVENTEPNMVEIFDAALDKYTLLRPTCTSVLTERFEMDVDKAAAILELSQLLQRKPRELSGGQRQRVAMGRAIVRQPQVFLFDEPLSNLDAKLRAQTRLEIQKLHRELGITSLFVTHDQVEAMTLAQRMIVMNGGVMEQFGTPEEVYNRPASTFVASFMGSPPMNLLQD